MQLHIANTFFEWELTEKKEPPFDQAFFKMPVFLQLQYLPLIYAPHDDTVLVTSEPDVAFWEFLETKKIKAPKIHLLSSTSFPKGPIESWGPSRSIAKWAKLHHLSYAMPPWDVVCEVNSKAFSFIHSPKLPQAALLHNSIEAQSWIEKQTAAFVFKTCFGVSGGGHLIADQNTPPLQIERFLNKEWKENRPVIAEPWVKRALDFSTQWRITEQGEILYLGATLCKSDDRGRHKGNHAGQVETLFGEHIRFLEEHKPYALLILKKMSQMGYFGNVGIDAMVYYAPDLKLHPIVEINARKTMGYAALEIQRLHFPNHTILLEYITKDERGFLPSSVKYQGKNYPFSKQLFIRTLD